MARRLAALNPENPGSRRCVESLSSWCRAGAAADGGQRGAAAPAGGGVQGGGTRCAPPLCAAALPLPPGRSRRSQGTHPRFRGNCLDTTLSIRPSDHLVSIGIGGGTGTLMPTPFLVSRSPLHPLLCASLPCGVLRTRLLHAASSLAPCLPHRRGALNREQR